MLHWNSYDRYKTKQKRFSPTEKLEFEQLAAAILELPAATMAGCWGTVCSPGRNAAVIKVHPEIRHRFNPQGQKTIGLKIFNLVDGQTMWPSLKRFYQAQHERLPGLPHPHVQEILAWGEHPDQAARVRGYEVVEWIEGTVLEDRLKEKFTVDEAMQWMDDLFLHLIIPLWSQGTSWWDVRRSNYVITPDGRLVMIDMDTLGGYADEILGPPGIYRKRNHGSNKAIERYRSLLVDLSKKLAPRGQKTKVQRGVQALVVRHLHPQLITPYPLAPDWAKKTKAAYQACRREILALLAPPKTIPVRSK